MRGAHYSFFFQFFVAIILSSAAAVSRPHEGEHVAIFIFPICLFAKKKKEEKNT